MQPNSTSLPQGLISPEIRKLLETCFLAGLASSVAAFGIVTNLINCIIFAKQGLDTTINISFFGLAISDLCGLLLLEWSCFSFNPLIQNTGIPWDLREIQYLSGGYPYLCFGRITCWITAYITAERCLCIALPLKVKQIVTPRRTTISLCFLYVMNLSTLIPEYCWMYFGWTFSPERNRSIIRLNFRQNMKGAEGVSFVLSAITGASAFPAVIVFTLILVIKLMQQAKWRKQSTGDKKVTGLTSKRDIKTMKMVVLISSILIACYTPGILSSVATFLAPGFSVSGRYVNLFYATWVMWAFLQAINSSVNIFMYYTMSTKFKSTFHEVFLVTICGSCYRKTETESVTDKNTVDAG